MPALRFPMRALLAASVSICASSCATPAPTRLSSPSAAIFTPEAKPVPPIAVLLNDDAEGVRRHQRDKDDWGQRGWDRVRLICLWFADQGVEGLPCSDDSASVQQR